jgi:hypothetical protein
MGRRREDLQETAEILGISSDAVRKRAKRGTLDHETGRQAVRLGRQRGAGQEDTPGRRPGPADRVPPLRAGGVTRRGPPQGSLIAALTQCIPELEASPEAPSEARESPESASEGPGDTLRESSKVGKRSRGQLRAAPVGGGEWSAGRRWRGDELYVFSGYRRTNHRAGTSRFRARPARPKAVCRANTRTEAALRLAEQYAAGWRPE